MTARLRWAGAALLMLITIPASALTLSEARQQGRAGETFSGYLAARQSDQSTRQLVAQINAGRRQQYQRIASQNGLVVDEVARMAGARLVARAAQGEYVQGLNGLWLQK